MGLWAAGGIKTRPHGQRYVESVSAAEQMENSSGEQSVTDEPGEPPSSSSSDAREPDEQARSPWLRTLALALLLAIALLAEERGAVHIAAWGSRASAAGAVGGITFPLHRGFSGAQWMTPKDIDSIEREFETEQAASLAPAEAGLFVNDSWGTHRPSAPLVSGDGFRVAADVRCVNDVTCNFDAAAWSLSHPGQTIIVFSNYDAVPKFFAFALPRLRNASLPFVFITHDSDYEAPRDDADATLLDEPLLRAWFGINPGRSHPKLKLLPYGFMNRCRTPVGDHPETIIAYRRVAASKAPTRHFLSSFSTETNPDVRIPLISAIENAYGDRSTRLTADSTEEWYAAVADHKMTASPTGHGLDTHRTWEILTLGRVPVVESSLLDPLFEGLPVLVLHSWAELADPAEVDRRYEEIAADLASGKYSSRRVWLSYYVCQIFAAAGRAHERGCPVNVMPTEKIYIPNLLTQSRQLITPARLVELETSLPPGLLGSSSRAPHVVISAYDEDLEWVFGIAALGWDATVYHKHPQRAAALRDHVKRRGAPGIQVVELENWGDEALPYLRFIVDNFDALPRATAFLHGNPKAHAPFLIDMLQCLDPEWTRVVRTLNFKGSAHGYFSLNNNFVSGRDVSYPPFLNATVFINNELEARGVAARIREPSPGLVSLYCCAQFVATPLAFLRLGKTFWEVMRDAALLRLPVGGAHEVRKSTAVYFEHIWHELLGQKQHLDRVLSPPADIRKAPFLPRCYVTANGEETPFARFLRLEFRR